VFNDSAANNMSVLTETEDGYLLPMKEVNEVAKKLESSSKGMLMLLYHKLFGSSGQILHSVANGLSPLQYLPNLTRLPWRYDAQIGIANSLRGIDIIREV